MKKSDIYEIAIKILGLYLFLTSIGYLLEVILYFVFLQYPTSFEGIDSTSLIIVNMGNFVLTTLFAFALTFKTKSIVKKLCNKSNFNEETQFLIDKIIIQEIVLKFTGLLIVVWTLPMVALKFITCYIKFVKFNIPLNDFDTEFLIVASIKILAGFIAIFFRKPISRFLSKESKDNQSKQLTTF